MFNHLKVKIHPSNKANVNDEGEIHHFLISLPILDPRLWVAAG